MSLQHNVSALRRLILSCAALAAASAIVRAQSAASATEPAAASEPEQQVVRMDQFEVSTTQGHGYVSTNAAEAFKTNSSLMDIPQIDVVITNDLIQDIGFENISDTMNYFGVYESFESDGEKMRGGGAATQLYIDEFPIHGGWSDAFTIDSLELIKGGAEGLYMLNSGLGGIVMKAEKKPQSIPMTLIQVSADEWGLYRANLDSTGPIGNIGGAEIDYRLILTYQHGTSYFDNIIDNKYTIYPYFQVKYKNTTVRFHVDGESMLSSQLGAELITPTGRLYTGAGRSVSNQPPNNANRIWEEIWEGTILQRFSDNWEMRLGGQYFNQGFWGPQVITSGSNFNPALANPYIYYTNRENDQRWKYWTTLSDISGSYMLGPSDWEMKQTTILGWAWTDQVVEKYIFSTTVYPFNDAAQGIPLLAGQPATSLAVQANSRAAINGIVVPPLNTYYAPSSGEGSHTTTLNGGLYFQHTANVVPNWFDLVIGESWINVVTDTITDVSVRPWSATELHFDQYISRVAGILHLARDVSIYALRSTNFSPPSTITYLQNGAFAPPQAGKDNEMGLKTAFLGGRVSADFSWFQMDTSNVAVPAGIFANGTSYSILENGAVQEGVDGDVAFALVPGWQLVGSFYAGHDRDQNNNPVSGSYDNSWGVFTRYDFQTGNPLHGLSVGGGGYIIGGRWIATTGVSNATTLFLPSAIRYGNIKVENGLMTNLFANYAFNRHLSIGVYCTNVLDQVFPLATQTAYEADPSPPTTFRVQANYKF